MENYDEFSMESDEDLQLAKNLNESINPLRLLSYIKQDVTEELDQESKVNIQECSPMIDNASIHS